ncbi:MAG TPA: DUF5719 family protein [Actinomycetota bacterium]|nr:DUF5719 family protein [Actinomycetota bacterium]
MIDRREVGLAATVGLLLLTGIAVDVFATEVGRRPPPPPSGARFAERASFCPPSLAGSTAFVVATAAGREEVSLGIEPARPERVVVEAGGVFVQELPDRAPAQVVGYGSAVKSGVVLRSQEPVAGEAGAQCAESASSRWFFAGGASTLEVDERLLIYNPFPDEAVVRVTFVTPVGEDRKGKLADVPVPAESVTIIKVNEFVHLERTLGVRIDTKRGRVVAWRALFDRPEEGSPGVQMTLGAPSDSDTWFFPEGTVAETARQRISLLNPNEEEATVTVSLSGNGKIVQADELVEIPVAAGTARGVTLQQVLGARALRAGAVSAVVQSTNGVGIIAERSMRYGDGRIRGSTAELGATRSSRAWMLPPATLRPLVDDVVVMNPGSRDAVVALTIRGQDRRPIQPASLQDETLAPGGRLRIDVTRWTRLRTAMVTLTSTNPVVAERFSYSDVSRDAGTVMGYALE